MNSTEYSIIQSGSTLVNEHFRGNAFAIRPVYSRLFYLTDALIYFLVQLFLFLFLAQLYTCYVMLRMGPMSTLVSKPFCINAF